MRVWMLRVGVMLLVGTLLGALSGCGHDPNHDIDMSRPGRPPAGSIRHPRRASR